MQPRGAYGAESGVDGLWMGEGATAATALAFMSYRELRRDFARDNYIVIEVFESLDGRCGIGEARLAGELKTVAPDHTKISKILIPAGQKENKRGLFIFLDHAIGVVSIRRRALQREGSLASADEILDQFRVGHRGHRSLRWCVVIIIGWKKFLVNGVDCDFIKFFFRAGVDTVMVCDHLDMLLKPISRDLSKVRGAAGGVVAENF